MMDRSYYMGQKYDKIYYVSNSEEAYKIVDFYFPEGYIRRHEVFPKYYFESTISYKYNILDDYDMIILEPSNGLHIKIFIDYDCEDDAVDISIYNHKIINYPEYSSTAEKRIFIEPEREQKERS